jgi:tetratricopeptide (TPR) repeat protein
MAVRRRVILAVVFAFVVGIWVAHAQAPVEQVPVQKNAPPPADNKTKPPRSDNAGLDESSSKETQIDISPPTGDAKDHPGAELDDESPSGEFTPWDPHKAMKDIEVGDFYAKRENYGAAISRYREALEFKPHDAEATYKLAEALEKSGDSKQALENYQEYLKILPRGPYAAQSKNAITRLKEKGVSSSVVDSNQPK